MLNQKTPMRFDFTIVNLKPFTYLFPIQSFCEVSLNSSNIFSENSGINKMKAFKKGLKSETLKTQSLKLPEFNISKFSEHINAELLGTEGIALHSFFIQLSVQ